MNKAVEIFGDKIIEKLCNLIEKDGSVCLAVSGGKSPIPLFEYLSKNDRIDWSKVIITLIDERATKKMEARNIVLVNQYLLQNCAKAAQFVNIYDDTKNIVDNIVDLNLNQNVISPKVAILGMGLDGHTASIFPCCPEFNYLMHTSTKFAIASPTTAEYHRITLTFSALLAIDYLFLFAQDHQKQEVLKQLIGDSNKKYPIAELIKFRQVDQ
jgi:6-phosphogluconolactonase